jgi:electron transport complex protein RnfB
MADERGEITRRQALRAGGRGLAVVALGAGGAALAARTGAGSDGMVWQIDPAKCTACGNCETHCVLTPSAVKAVHTHGMCGRCSFCFGYYDLRAGSVANAGAEYQLCPTNAILREYLGGPYFEYVIDEALCIACGLCVKGCTSSGNGSLYLQVRHKMVGEPVTDVPDGRCVDCNECAIAAACPAGAFVRVPASTPHPFPRGGAGH